MTNPARRTGMANHANPSKEGVRVRSPSSPRTKFAKVRVRSLGFAKFHIAEFMRPVRGYARDTLPSLPPPPLLLPAISAARLDAQMTEFLYTINKRRAHE